MKLIDHSSARVIGLTVLAGMWGAACGNNDTPNDGFATVSTGGTSAASTLTGGAPTGGHKATGGVPPSVGGTATSGGSKSTSGGTAPSAGGTSTTTGGTSSTSAGTSATTGGTSTAAGGGTATGGTSTDLGGTSATNGGTTSATGGTSATAGTSAVAGGTSAIGGTSAAVGGTSAATGGDTSATGGDTSATGGTAASTGGTSSIATGGTAATTGGDTSATGGTAAATGGDTSATGGTVATGGTPATGGSLATGGALATGGTVATGGVQGTGGSSSASCPIIYDFETDVQGWTGDTGLTFATSTANSITGSQSLKVSVPAIAEGTGKSITVNPTTAANLWPGTVLTFNVMVPAGVTNVWMQAYSQDNNYALFDTTGNSAVTVNPGGWTTWTYTIPNTFPGGIQVLGIQIGVNTGGTFAAGDVYIDSITGCAGPAVCAGSGSGNFGWETAASVDGWAIDGNATPADTAIAQAGTMPNSGVGSLQVSFTALPANTSRRIVLDKPNAYCGQVITYKVYVPSDFGADLTIQPFASVNGWVWNQGTSVTPTLGAWNTITYTVPPIGPLGLQRIGLQISSATTSTPYTGSIYLDDVSW